MRRFFGPCPRSLTAKNSAPSQRKRRANLRLEPLEARCLPSSTTFTVFNTNDSGTGSLRQAIINANNNPNSAGSVDRVVFSPGIANQTITLTSGDIEITDGVAIVGSGNVKVDGNKQGLKLGTSSRIFEINMSPTSGNVNISNLTLQNGRASGGNGGAIYAYYANKVTLNHVRIQGCEAIGDAESGGEGGGIEVEMGQLVVVNSVITGNTATSVSPTYSYGTGGGISVCSCATLFIQNSTISNNHADKLGAGIHLEGEGTIQGTTISGNVCGGEAGGLCFISTGTLTLTNCTIAKNRGSSVGALYAVTFSVGQVTIQNSTIAQNTAATGVGGIMNLFGEMRLKNTIVASNKAGTAIVDLGNEEGIIDATYCLIQVPGSALAGSTSNHNIIGVAPLLGPLAFNGGPTQTMALLPGSRAINAGDPNFQPPPSTDQRGPGFARVSGGRIDIGAFEVQAAGSGHRGQR